MQAAKPTALFPCGYKEHVAYAMRMVANGVWVNVPPVSVQPPVAIAAVYLVTRFEFFFRLLSGKLNGNGTWLNKAVDQPAAVKKLRSCFKTVFCH